MLLAMLTEPSDVDAMTRIGEQLMRVFFLEMD